ncbi:MAG: hypothetical protein KC422_01720 [Trueperaceae bacterium]|nr:hypothetical protein [Trueperaceae bacterium]
MNRLVLRLLACLVLSVALAQEINRQEAPTFTLNAMVLDQSSPLILEGSHLSPEMDYELKLTDPAGNVVLEEQLRSSADGTIIFDQALAEQGIWQVAIRGEDARAIFEVEVNEASETAVTTEGVDSTASSAQVHQAEEVAVAEPAATEASTPEPGDTEAAETVDTATEEAAEVAPAAEAATETTEDNAVSDINAETTETSEQVAEENAPLEGDTQAVTAEEALTEAEPIDATEADTLAETPAETAETTVEVQPEVAVEAPEASPATPEGSSETTAATEAALVAEASPAEAQATEEPDPQSSETTAETPAETMAEAADESQAQTDVAQAEDVAGSSEAATPLPGVDPSSVSVTLEGSSVLGQANGAEAWRLDFPVDSGETAGLLETPTRAYMGHGNSLLELDKSNGKVLNRWALAGQIRDISGAAESLTVTTQVGAGAQTFQVENGVIAEPVRFAAEPELFSWLKNEAEVDNPAQRLEQDPTNPYLYLKEADSSGAIDAAKTFYDLAGVARSLVDAGELDLANQAMDKAMTDFARRGYDPRLLRDLNLHEAYNFPLRPLEAAVATGDGEKAAFWANWLKYFITPETPQTAEAMRDYASLVARQQDRAAAKEWRTLANNANRSNVATVIDNFFGMLGRTGWYEVISFLVAIIALHLVLLFKYWSPQSLFLRRRKAMGRSSGAVPRLFVMRYYSTFEKLVLVLLFAATLLLAGLATWNEQSVSSLAIDSGSLNEESLSQVNSATLAGPRGNFIKGYVAQVSGETSQAESAYAAAGDLPAALNNLAALSNDPGLYQAALDKAPNMSEAKYNLGQEVDGLLFQKDYQANQAVLAVPSQDDIQAATAGSWQNAVAITFSNPWTALRFANPLPSWGGPRLSWLSQYLWYLIMVLFFLWALVTVVWLFIPRPRLARNAPRNPAYELLALLIPGSGAADEMWGLLLLVPWAIIGLDTLADIFNWGFGIGLTRRWDYILLGIIYLINTVAVVVEFFSYSRRMRALKRDDEDLAREFHLTK